MLGEGQVRSLTEDSEGDDPVTTRCTREVDLPLHRLVVDRAVLVEGRGKDDPQPRAPVAPSRGARLMTHDLTDEVLRDRQA